MCGASFLDLHALAVVIDFAITLSELYVTMCSNR